MLKEVILLILGLIGLWYGAGLTIDGCKRLGKKYNISYAVLGLTIISIGTSLPEIMTNIISGLKNLSGEVDASGIAVGTNLGSDITQITFILGLTALFGTMYATKKTLYRDGLMILISIIALFIAGFNGKISQAEGMLLVIAYIVYIVVVSRDSRVLKDAAAEMEDDSIPPKKHIKLLTTMSLLVMGIGVLIIASHLVVNNAILLSDSWGIAQSFVGVMIIGVGTGLPELSTALRGVMKKAGTMSLGTLIGSNITDPMLSMGIGASIAGFTVDRNLLFFDIPFWFMASLVALFMISNNMKIGKEDKKEGIILLMMYAFFVLVKFTLFMK